MKPKKNKLQGARKQAVGIIKEKAGKLVGGSKLEAKGTVERIKGDIQSAVGNLQSAAISGMKKLSDTKKRAGKELKKIEKAME